MAFPELGYVIISPEKFRNSGEERITIPIPTRGANTRLLKKKKKLSLSTNGAAYDPVRI